MLARGAARFPLCAGGLAFRDRVGRAIGVTRVAYPVAVALARSREALVQSARCFPDFPDGSPALRLTAMRHPARARRGVPVVHGPLRAGGASGSSPRDAVGERWNTNKRHTTGPFVVKIVPMTSADRAGHGR
jgi:hypothetical protein